MASLDTQLRRGPKSLVGNRGYRKYVRTTESSFDIDREKVEDEARFDGLWVLRTDLDLHPAEVALKYKELWQVEDPLQAAGVALGPALRFVEEGPNGAD